MHNQQRGGVGGETSLTGKHLANPQNSKSQPQHQQRPKSSNITYGNYLNKNREEEQQQAQQSFMAGDDNFAANSKQIARLNDLPQSINLQLKAQSDLIESDRLNKSMDSHSISSFSSISVAKQPFKHTFNIASSSTIKNGNIGGGPLSYTVQGGSNRPKLIPNLPISGGHLQVLHQDISHADNNESKGSAIRGRRVDSPRLVVVKELRDQEDQDEFDLYAGKKDDLRQKLNPDSQQYIPKRDQSKSREGKRLARSVENPNKKRRSKERPLQVNQTMIHKPPLSNAMKIDDKSMQKPAKIQNNKGSTAKSNVRSNSKDTKSSRDIRQSAAFNDLLNQLDKEVKISQNSQLVDFKNRTTNEKLASEFNELNGQSIAHAKIEGPRLKPNLQNNHRISSQERHQSSKSRSKERQPQANGGVSLSNFSRANLVQNLQAILPISLTSQAQNHERNRKKNGSNNLTDVTPDKSSFMQSEHGRCVTSQAVHQSQYSLNQNGRALTLTASNVGPQRSTYFMKQGSACVLNEQLNHGSNNGAKIMKDQSSPDRSSSAQLFGKASIDQIVKQNLKKIKSKIEEERAQRQVSEERQKKKKEIFDQNNNLVRQINKEKTYKRNQILTHQNLALSNQQSQGQDYPGSNPAQQIKIWAEQKQVKNLNLSKLSQSQRIDFDKIKDDSRLQRSNANGPPAAGKSHHRKSYGLEFLEIKKEIQDELKTIEHRINQTLLEVSENQLIPSHSEFHRVNSSSDFNGSVLPNKLFKNEKIHPNLQPKKLNIKKSNNLTSNTGSSLLDISMGGLLQGGCKINKTERVHTEGMKDEGMGNPVQKVVVIKKSKIRQFMKLKKKEKQIEQQQQQKAEVLRTIKMQENIIRLNDFCKKNLLKNICKKRNTTLQNPNNNLSLKQAQDQTDLLALYHKLESKNAQVNKSKRDNKIPHQDNNEDDSSRLSTEFYEEYYRLINSLKKDDQMPVHDIVNDIQLSRAQAFKNSPSSKSMMINQIQNTLTVDDSQLVRQQNPPVKISKSSLSHNKNGLRQKSKQGNIKILKSKIHRPTQQPHISKEMLKIAFQQFNEGTRQQKSRERAESAPLYKKKLAALQAKTKKQQLNTSLGKQEQGSKNKRTSTLEIATHNAIEEINEDSAETIQRIPQKVQSHSNSSYSKRQDFIDSETGQVIQYVETDHEEEEPTVRQQTNVEEMPNFTGDPYGDEEDYDEEDNGEDDGTIDHANLIIINEQQFADDEKKVVYLSNINSCSLPQTPKLDESKKQSVENSKPIFEQNISGDFIHQSSESSSLLDERDLMNRRRSQSTDPVLSIINQREIEQQQAQSGEFDNEAESKSNDHENEEFLKTQERIQDYQMRIFTGSQSLLKELKMSTPKNAVNSAFKMLDDPATGCGSRRHLTSHHSQSSLIKSRIDQTQPIADHNAFTVVHSGQTGGLDQREQDALQYVHMPSHVQTNPQALNSQTHTSQSQSSQSLFDRNSFQQFTANKLQKIVQNNEFMHLIAMREKALDYRQEKERKYIKKMYKSRQFSPRTYNQRKEQLERWVTLEKEEILKSKKQFHEEWEKTVKMIEDTQKNVDIMREQIKSHGDGTTHHHAVKQHSQSSRISNASYLSSSHKKDRKPVQEDYMLLHSNRSNRMLQFQNQQDNLRNAPQEVPEQVEAQVVLKQSASLIDFLEESWKNSQPTLPVQANDIQPGTEILIHDYKDKNEEVKDSAAQGPFSYDNSEENCDDNISQIREENDFDDYKGETNSEVESNVQLEVVQVKIQPSKEEERQLLRSRSEQDLSDLIKRTNKAIQQEQNPINGISDEDSFRILDSERQQNQNSSQILNFANNQPNDQIRIQENLFEDSSQRQQVSNQEEGLFNPNIMQGGVLLDPDLPSQDSLLNEQEFNHHFFKDNQKFSIEDFKQLDKRRLLKDDDNSELDQFSERLLPSAKTVQDQFKAQEEVVGVDDIMLEEIKEEKQDPPSGQSTSQLLFQNARPGENIKISDILRKNAKLQFGSSSNESTQLLADIIQSKVKPILPSSPSEKSDHFKFALEEIGTSHPLDERESEHINQRILIGNELSEDILILLISQEVENHLMSSSEAQSPQKHNNSSPNQNQSTNNTLSCPVVVHNSPEHAPCGDTFIVDNPPDKESRRELVDFKQRMLVEQDLQRIENYINEVITMLQQHELNYLEALTSQGYHFANREPNYHRQFLQVLTIPIKRNELDLLNQLQTSEIGSYEHFETAMDMNGNPILPVDLYLDIERQREEHHLRILYQNPAMQNAESNSAAVAQDQEPVHIMNKAIFDALNESLLKFRPYGIQGEPMAWSNKVRRLQTKVDTNQVDTERLFFMVKQDVMRWAQNCVGCLPSSVFVMRKPVENSGGMRPQYQDAFDEELFQETREKRLAAMLANEVVETEHQWLNYEFEEAQVKIDMSDMVLEHLVEEVVVFMNRKAQENILASIEAE